MPIFLRLILGVALNYLGSLLVKQPTPKGTTQKDLGIPRADEGSPPFAGGGTFIQRSAYVVDIMDFESRVVKIKQKKK